MKYLATWILVMSLGAVVFGCGDDDTGDGDTDTDTDTDTNTDTDSDTDTDTETDTNPDDCPPEQPEHGTDCKVEELQCAYGGFTTCYCIDLTWNCYY